MTLFLDSLDPLDFLDSLDFREVFITGGRVIHPRHVGIPVSCFDSLPRPPHGGLGLVGRATGLQAGRTFSLCQHDSIQGSDGDYPQPVIYCVVRCPTAGRLPPHRSTISACVSGASRCCLPTVLGLCPILSFGVSWHVTRPTIR